MSWGMGNVGGINNAFAVIAVIYPSGSTCTCTNGVKTLTAKGTGGSYLFMIPTPQSLPETWTIHCIDGDHPDGASKNVTITAKYQAKTVTLAYEVVLYDNGNEAIELTGGYQIFGSASKGVDRISYVMDTEYGAGATTNNLINFSGYTKLLITCLTQDQYEIFAIRFGVSETKISSGSSAEHEKFSVSIAPDIGQSISVVELTLPENYTGYFGFCGVGDGYVTRVVAI